MRAHFPRAHACIWKNRLVHETSQSCNWNTIWSGTTSTSQTLYPINILHLILHLTSLVVYTQLYSPHVRTTQAHSQMFYERPLTHVCAKQGEECTGTRHNKNGLKKCTEGKRAPGHKDTRLKTQIVHGRRETLDMRLNSVHQGSI